MKSILIILSILSVLAVAACAGSRLPAPRAHLELAPAPDHHADKPGPQPTPVPKPNIVVTTGVHGNEPSGYLIKDKLTALGFTTYGPCNPWGIEHNKRLLEDGRDLNRMFGRTDCPEAEKIKKWLGEHRPDFLLDLHEDPSGTAPYLIQHGPDDDIGRAIINALKDRYKFDPEPTFMMAKGEDGVLKPDRKVLAAMAFIKIYGLAYYAWATFGCTAIVVECPGSWDVEKRKAYHYAVCTTAKRIFEERWAKAHAEEK